VVVRGPVSIVEDTIIKNGTYAGPYTLIGANSELEYVHIKNSLVIGRSIITVPSRTVDSLLGRNADLESAEKLSTRRDGASHQYLLGQHTQLVGCFPDGFCTA
jgi:glucose-1-phosphate thymidylyltransferase